MDAGERDRRMEAAARLVAALVRGRTPRELSLLPEQSGPERGIERAQREIVEKYFDMAAFEGTLTEGFAREFSESELEEIQRFLESSTGKKYLLLQPRLGSDAAREGLKACQEHRAEIATILRSATRGD